MKISEIVFGAFLLLAAIIPATAQTTAFSYQGHLNNAGAPANGTYDMQFDLYLAASGGASLATVTNAAVTVTNGIFTVNLDFGSQFPGANRGFSRSVPNRQVSPAFCLIVL